MREIIIIGFVAGMLFIRPAHADQVVVLCTQSTNGAFTNCVPVSSSNPLPVKMGN